MSHDDHAAFHLAPGLLMQVLNDGYVVTDMKRDVEMEAAEKALEAAMRMSAARDLLEIQMIHITAGFIFPRKPLRIH